MNMTEHLIGEPDELLFAADGKREHGRDSLPSL